MPSRLLAPKPDKNNHVRRLSSRTATEDDFVGGPATVAPDSLLASDDGGDSIAASIEVARSRIGNADATPAGSPGETHVTDRYAFAFDIDGVLIKGGEVIPEAKEAMQVLNGKNEYGIKVPYIFVTNGGGKTEEERCIQLSKQLEIEVSPGQFICGHTPMRELAVKYETILVVGGEGEKCREVAEGYGFRDVVTPGDIIKDNHATTPFRTLTDTEHEASRPRNFAEVEINAICVFADSRDWASDIQIIIDICTSKNGRLGTRSDNYDEGPPVFFSHSDVVWATSHESSRLGMGALRANLEATFKSVTGKELVTTAFGKPQMETFEFATRLLQQWRKDTHGINAPPDTVYFVGDTPESDIRGTNDFDKHSDERTHWFSILVRSGVFRDGTTPAFKPRQTVDTVLDAVNFGIQREISNDVKKELNKNKV
ncbi:MAG: hypothetical protein M1814_005293 [Vezdaea aestivalis]|nr:MAG: hypothetical protein M1814_005293 [Vezdaea aestivalis]